MHAKVKTKGCLNRNWHLTYGIDVFFTVNFTVTLKLSGSCILKEKVLIWSRNIRMCCDCPLRNRDRHWLGPKRLFSLAMFESLVRTLLMRVFYATSSWRKHLCVALLWSNLTIANFPSVFVDRFTLLLPLLLLFIYFISHIPTVRWSSGIICMVHPSAR